MLVDRLAHALYRFRGRRAKFERLYRESGFGGCESISGPGSSLAASESVRAALPGLLRQLGARTLLDVPCGDFHWMRETDLGDVRYVGADIVAPLVAANAERYGRAGRTFVVLDAVADPLPRADLVLCRDLLIHLSFRDGLRALKSIAESGATWLLTTTFPAVRENIDIVTGRWHPVNLELPPYGFPPPERLVNEGCRECGGSFQDKSLGLWRLDRRTPEAARA